MTLRDSQPILHHILTKSFENNKIPHAFLLIGKNAQQPAHFIAKSLICQETLLACNECNDCIRVDNHNYADLIYINGRNESIKKGHIEAIQEQFTKSAIEGDTKVYMLENIENTSVEAMNSLLKFLEEPIPHIYAILTCQNLDLVLPTIQSRCQIIQLLPNSQVTLKKQLSESDIAQDDINILSELFETYEECEEYIDSEVLEKMKLEVYHFIEDLYFHRENLIINVQTQLLKTFKEKAQLQLFLNMLVLGFKDLFHVKQSIELTYSAYRELFTKIDDEPEDIIRKIALVLDTEYLLNSNANVALLMDSMMYNI